MARKINKPHERPSIIREELAKKKRVSDVESEGHFLVSLKHLDQSQGNTLSEWEKEQKLSLAIETLRGYSQRALTDQYNGKKFALYGGFPPKEKTDFSHPQDVPEDAHWARIHVAGEQCIIGHVIRQTFYIVFLDGNHSFWKIDHQA